MYSDRIILPVNLLSSVLMLGFALCFTGCTTCFNVDGNKQLQKEAGYRVIDACMRNAGSGWYGPGAKYIGASESGFTFIGAKGKISKQEGGVWGIYDKGEPVTYKWTDIASVEACGVLSSEIIFCGLIDPTMHSHVVVSLKNGRTLMFPTYDNTSEYAIVSRLAPVWFFNPGWVRAQQIGQAFQSIIDAPKEP